MVKKIRKRKNPKKIEKGKIQKKNRKRKSKKSNQKKKIEFVFSSPGQNVCLLSLPYS